MRQYLLQIRENARRTGLHRMGASQAQQQQFDDLPGQNASPGGHALFRCLPEAQRVARTTALFFFLADDGISFPLVSRGQNRHHNQIALFLCDESVTLTERLGEFDSCWHLTAKLLLNASSDIASLFQLTA